MSKYNLVIATIHEIAQERNGDLLVSGVVSQAHGAGFGPGDPFQVKVSAKSAGHLKQWQEDESYLLENVDPDAGTCQRITAAGERGAFHRYLIGPLQIRYVDGQNNKQYLTLAGDITAELREKVAEIVKNHAASVHVGRDLIPADENGKPASVVVPREKMESILQRIGETKPDVTQVMVRDGDRHFMVKMKYDKDGPRPFEMPAQESGAPISWGDQVELIAIEHRAHLVNTFASMKSSAIAELSRFVKLTDSQRAVEGKIYPSWDHFAMGFVKERALPSGGHTIDGVAVNSPSAPVQALPGALPCAKAETSPQNIMRPEDALVEFLMAAMKSKGVPAFVIDQVQQSWSKAGASNAAEKSARASQDPQQESLAAPPFARYRERVARPGAEASVRAASTSLVHSGQGVIMVVPPPPQANVSFRRPRKP